MHPGQTAGTRSVRKLAAAAAWLLIRAREQRDQATRAELIRLAGELRRLARAERVQS